jgi:hypothetical protein
MRLFRMASAFQLARVIVQKIENDGHGTPLKRRSGGFYCWG